MLTPWRAQRVVTCLHSSRLPASKSARPAALQRNPMLADGLHRPTQATTTASACVGPVLALARVVHPRGPLHNAESLGSCLPRGGGCTTAQARSHAETSSPQLRPRRFRPNSCLLHSKDLCDAKSSRSAGRSPPHISQTDGFVTTLWARPQQPRLSSTLSPGHTNPHFWRAGLISGWYRLTHGKPRLDGEQGRPNLRQYGSTLMRY